VFPLTSCAPDSLLVPLGSLPGLVLSNLLLPVRLRIPILVLVSRQDTARLVFAVSACRPAQVSIFRLAFHFCTARFGIRLLGSACPDFVPACVKSSVHRAGTPVASMRDQLVLPRSGPSVILLAQSRSVRPKFIDCPRPGVPLLDSCSRRQRFGLVMSP
jgi:hypothetical protein